MWPAFFRLLVCARLKAAMLILPPGVVEGVALHIVHGVMGNGPDWIATTIDHGGRDERILRNDPTPMIILIVHHTLFIMMMGVHVGNVAEIHIICGPPGLRPPMRWKGLPGHSSATSEPGLWLLGGVGTLC